jgi:hypothetical protein
VAYLNVSSPSTRAQIQIHTATITTTSSGLTLKSVQDVTINNSNGTFSWTQLDSQSQLTVATPATNSIAANIVVDDSDYFTATTGIFDLSNNKTLVYFRVYYNGKATGAKFVSGSGYITNLAPSVSPTAPVWVTPLTISVDGDFTAGTVA